jgi:hypothetical protein
MIETTIESHSTGNNRKRLFIAGIILLAVWITITFIPLVLKNKLGSFVFDYHDTAIYFERGKWLTEGTPPISEYPQIPTFLFGIDRLLSGWVDTNMQFNVFVAILSLEMLLILFLFFKGLLAVLPKGFGNYAFLALLPPTVYFTYNRFDILPAYLCLIAFIAATKKQWIMASIILSIATFTKWYPALLFPGFFMYATTLEKKFQWKMILSFAITSIAILLLSYLYSGLEPILAPYQFHIARDIEFLSFPVFLSDFIRGALDIQRSLPYYFLFLFIIQVSAPILIFFIKLDSLDALIHYCIIVTAVFILFSRIWSPQWFLWLLPFLIISSKNLKTAGVILVYNLITYLGFPVFFVTYGQYSDPLRILILLTYFFIFAMILRSIVNIMSTRATPSNQGSQSITGKTMPEG